MQRRRSSHYPVYDQPGRSKRANRSPPRRRRGSSVGGGEAITKALKNDDGLSALEIFLQNYTRISSNTGCEGVDLGGLNLHVWVYVDNYWTKWPHKKKDGFLKSLLKVNPDQSVCNALLTNVFKLSDVQYQTMKNSFLSPAWRDVAGLYKHNTTENDFAIVVRLPVFRSVIGTVGNLALGGGLGLAAPIATRALALATEKGVQYFDGNAPNIAQQDAV